MATGGWRVKPLHPSSARVVLQWARSIKRLCEGFQGRDPTMPHSCRSLVPRKGINLVPHHRPIPGGWGRFTSWSLWVAPACQVWAKPFLLWVSNSPFSWQACFVLPSLAVLRARKEVEKFAALSVEISALSRAHGLGFGKGIWYNQKNLGGYSSSVSPSLLGLGMSAVATAEGKKENW